MAQQTVKQEYREGTRRFTALDARGWNCTELLLPSLSQVGGRRKNVKWWSHGPSHRTHTAGQTAAQASQEASAVITIDPAESLKQSHE